MRYTVLVEKPAENQLTRIWARAADQQAVADASDRIDAELADDAHTKGVPLGIFRKYTDPPLSVLFYVDPGDRKVHVIQYRRIP
jgi:hypothetical protein